MEKICETCKFWEREGQGWHCGDGMGRSFQICKMQECDMDCGIIPYIIRKGIVNWSSMERLLSDNIRKDLSTSANKSKYDIRARGVLTAPWFGCNMWGEK